MAGESTRRPLGLPDLLAAALFAGVAATLARVLFQERMLGDGAGYATFFARGDRLAYHFLYLPACRLVAPLARALDAGDPIEATRVASQAAYGAGVAFTFLLARELGATRFGAAAGTALCALAPAALFFGTTVEVHALHFATVAGASFALLRLPWRRPVLATALAALLYGLVFWAHQVGALLGPGFVALAAVGARAAGRPLGRRALLLGVGPALLLGLAAASLLASGLRTGSWSPSADEELRVLRAFSRPEGAWRFAWDGWLRPLGLLPVAAAVGLARGGLVAGARAALGWSIAVPFCVLCAWGVAEYGGYALGHASFLACFAACALPRPDPRAAWAAGLALLAQGALALSDVRAAGRGWNVDARAALVREHLGDGTFVATVDNAPALDLYLPGARVVSAREAAIHGLTAGRSAEAVAQALLALARAEVERGGRVLVDLGHETQREREPIRALLPVLDPFVAGLEAEFPTRRIEDRFWPLLVVER